MSTSTKGTMMINRIKQWLVGNDPQPEPALPPQPADAAARAERIVAGLR